MRIITGIYKGRRFDVPRTFKARPTTDFAKENLFNVLMGYIDLDGIRALDLFAGTGSISLELLSRGCREVVSVERDRDHCAFIRQCLTRLDTDKVILIRGDALKYIKNGRQQFDFIFADPPYALEQLPLIPKMILEGDMLKPGGLFVFEHGHNHSFTHMPQFVEQREYGSVNFSIFRQKATTKEERTDEQTTPTNG
ncbi:MAG: 16S rRNA (guanine(966)-N(2))-methyltransferase RsmD [Prevotella sp.]|nr:16S rRNA (guanine(966)-N(2))-methyltransferase RsmD [Prevotella sp.]